jgi:TonB family protein
MSQKQFQKIAAVALLIVVQLSTPLEVCNSQASKQISSPQSEPNDKSPSQPIILPGYSGSIRRGVCRGEAIKVVQPIYPPEAKKEGIKGNVVAEIIIDETGSVESARALSGPDALKDVALEAAKKWKFRVSRISGKRVKIACVLSFSFPPRISQAKKVRSGYKRGRV